MDLDWSEHAGDGFVTDQERDHRENNRASETSQIAEFAGAEGEVRIPGVPPGVRVGERRQEQRTSVGTHVQTIRHERDRSKKQAADNLGAHHRATQPDHGPGFALTLLVPLAQEDVLMESRLCGLGIGAHGCTHFK